MIACPVRQITRPLLTTMAKSLARLFRSHRRCRIQMSKSVDTRMSQDWNQRTPVSEEYLRASTIGELTALAAAVLLVDYDPQWPNRFEEEAKRIRAVLCQHALRVGHVGSTSIPGL